MAVAQKLDLYKLHKSEYVTPKKPVFIDTKAAKYLTIQGKGEPGGAEFQAQVGALHGVAYTLKFASKFAGRDYRVCHLEGLWMGPKGWDISQPPPKEWRWKLLIRVPDFTTEEQVKQAIAELKKKGKAPAAPKVKLATIDEGRCVQMLHVGPYSEEVKTVEQMMAAAQDQGLKVRGPHHEIYLSDPRMVAPERLRTILRYSVA